MFFNNDIKKCKLLEKFSIDIEKEQQKDPKTVKKLVEIDNYIFYIYNNPKVNYDSFYILRQDKNKKKNIVSLEWIDEKFLDYSCVFDNNLIFAVGGNPEMNKWDYFQFINIFTGERQRVKLRSDYGNMEIIGGYGRVYNQDKIIKMYNNNGNLIVEFHRNKSNSKNASNYIYNNEMDYILTLSANSGKISAHRTFEDKN